MINEEDFNEEYVLEVAKSMCVASRTAPKARGRDNLVIKICDKKDILLISKQLEKDYKEKQQEFLLRDSQNILLATNIVLIATHTVVFGLDCGYCGFASCKEKEEKAPNAPCFFNSNDLGIAVGSACSVASERKVDSRVMFYAGNAAKEIGMVKDCNQCLAICLSATNKNPFFDRCQ